MAFDADPDGLCYYQREAATSVVERLREDRSTLIDMATGLGKQQPVSEPVLTPRGWTTMGSLRVGDHVVGSDGKPTIVTGVFPQGIRPVFRVELSDGTFARAGAEHLWAVRTKHARLRGRPYKVMTTAAIAATIHRDWQLPVVAPVAFVERDLPCDPYALGIALGDGTMAGTVSVCTDDWIGEQLGWRKTRSHGSGGIGYWSAPRDFSVAVHGMGLRGKTSEAKFVPHEFLVAGPGQRLALLQGLMDTDGYAMPDGGAEFCSTSRALVDAVCECVRSLGGVSRGLREASASYVYKGERRQGQRAWRVNVKLPGGVPMFRLPRKASAYQTPTKYQPARIIRSVVDEGAVEEQVCISVAAGDRLYITRDYILTHNSVTIAALVKHWPGDVLVLAHRNELIEQLRDHLERATGQRVEIEKAESRSTGTARIVVGSVQSFNARRLEGFARDRFSLVVIDEAHHATSPSYTRIFKWFMEAKLFGVTATPDRSDGAALGQVFESVAYRMGIEDGIDAGYLVPLRGKVVDVEEIDISDVGKTGKDLAAGQLDEAMLEAVEPIVHGIVAHGEGRQGLVFCPGVKTAALGAERMNILQPDSSRFVSGDTPFDERKLTVQRFREGRVKYLWNCMVFTEGFDAPPASLVALARPTLSRSLMAQMVGRVTRPTTTTVYAIPGEEGATERRMEIEWSSKPDALILDFVGNSGKHSLASPIDALAGNYTDAEIKVAKKKKGGNLQQNLREARAELKALAAAVEAKARTKATEFDPFTVLKIDRDQLVAFEENYGRSPPTSSQVWAARLRGMTSGDLNGLSKHALSKLLERDKGREAKGWATYAQTRVLRRYPGMPENVRAEHAAEAIEHVQRKWGYPSSINVADVVRIAKGE